MPPLRHWWGGPPGGFEGLGSERGERAQGDPRGPGGPPHQGQANLCYLVGLVDRRFQIEARRKSRNTFGGDLDRLAVSGIPHTARLSVQHPKRTEAGYGHTIPADQPRLNPLQAGI